MIDITIEPVVAHTIYKGGRSGQEDFARRHPEATVSFMLDWKRAELEKFTYLEPLAAHSFMRLQEAWLAQPGKPDLRVSDMLRPVLQQIKLKRRKPRLAAKPGTSLHGLGLAVDYDTENLGCNTKGRKYAFTDFHEFIQQYGWVVHHRAFTSCRHAEAWHIEYRGWPTHSFGHQMDLIRWMMDENQGLVEGHESELVTQTAALMGVKALAFVNQVHAIQRMGGLKDDGIIGPITRGYLALLSITYTRRASSYVADATSEDSKNDKPKARRVKKS